jgi:hypothetical protein
VIYLCVKLELSLTSPFLFFSLLDIADSHPLHGATDNFMHPMFAKQMGLGLCELPMPKKIFNIDNTMNKSGKIMHYLDLDFQTGIHKEMRFLITDIGSKDLLLGYPWLATFEPKFNWRSATINKHILPIFISSINPRVIQNRPVITALLTEEEKQSIDTVPGVQPNNDGQEHGKKTCL